MTRRLKTAICTGLFVAQLTVGSLSADVVHLKNGRSIEGIVLEESAVQVMIKLAYGEIGLPRSSILEVERGESALAEYLEQRDALVQYGASAAEWLALARWADGHGLGHSRREASLVAARLEPGLEGLAPLMRRHGYVFDPDLAVWMPYEELMRRQGFVLSGDRWLSPAEAMAERRAQEESVRQRQEQQRQDRLARAVEMMALAQIAEAAESRRRFEETPTYPVGLPLYGGYPVVVPPGRWPGAPQVKPRPPHSKPGHRPQVEHRWSRETNRGGIQQAAGSSKQP